MAKRKKPGPKPKRKQGPKPGKVIRVPKHLMDYINARRRVGDTYGQALERLIKPSERTGPTMWTLPSKLVPTRAEALGLALEEAIKLGKAPETRETPVKVLEA